MLDVVRQDLFGTHPLDTWPGPDAPAGEPWATFARGRRAARRGDRDAALAAWNAITKAKGIESPFRAQAWHFLRLLGVEPPAAQAKTLFGVIYEFPDGNGFDLLAAYADGTLRYYGHRAGGFVLQHPAAPVGKAVDSVLAAGRTLVLGVGPWSKPDLPPLPEGHLRVSMVAPSGIHFGMGPAADLAADAQAKPAVAAGFALLERVVALVARR